MFENIVSCTLDGPAAVDLDTGVLYLNKDTWHKLSPHTRKFVLLHELGHLSGHLDEKGADIFALNKMLKNDEKLSQAINAMYEGLDFSTQEQYDRLDNIIINAVKYEAFFRGNVQAKKVYESIFKDSSIKGFGVGEVISLISSIGGLIAGEETEYVIDDEGNTVNTYETSIQSSVGNATNGGANIYEKAYQDAEEGDYWGWAVNVFSPGLAGIYNWYKDTALVEAYEAEQLEKEQKAATLKKNIAAINDRYSGIVSENEKLEQQQQIAKLTNEALQSDVSKMSKQYLLIGAGLVVFALLFI